MRDVYAARSVPRYQPSMPLKTINCLEDWVEKAKGQGKVYNCTAVCLEELCKGWKDCCKDTKLCGYNEGDCDNNKECQPGFYCGENNCDGVGFGNNADCCTNKPHQPTCCTNVIQFDGIWGDWGPVEMCSGNGHAIDFSLKVEPNQDGGDDTALNGICLICSGGDEICSTEGPWGDDFHESTQGKCEAGMTAFKMKFQEEQGADDDTAANDLMLRCKDDGLWKQVPEFHNWGNWSEVYSCPSGSVICGLSTRVEKRQGRGDDTSLNGVKFWCC